MRVPVSAIVIACFLVAATPARAAPTLQPVDGGPGYFGAHGLPAGPGFFPIMSWFRPAENAAQIATEKDFGMNTYLGIECPECANLQAVRDAGMSVFMDSGEIGRFTGVGSETVGYEIGDEEDMCCGPPGFAGGNGYDHLKAQSDKFADSKPRYTNFGKGVLLWEDDAGAAKFVNLPFLSYTSNDLYWMTDPNERGDTNPSAVGKYGLPASYGWNVQRQRYLDSLDGASKPTWTVVELGWPFTEGSSQGGRRILPAEARAATWHSIIAGTRGIEYFDHNFGPNTPGSTILGDGYADTRAVIKAVNQQIVSLAPVLNSPTVSSGYVTAGAVRAMVKWDGRHFYVFAGATSTANTSFDVTIPCVGDATATVLGEGGGTIPVTVGRLTAQLVDKNAAHIYRIDGGSTCGLGTDPTPTPTPTPSPTPSPSPTPTPTPSSTPTPTPSPSPSPTPSPTPTATPTPAPFNCDAEPVCADWKARALRAEDQVARIKAITQEAP